MNGFIYFVVFLLGAVIGSFINCIIYRLHANKSFTRGRSFCPKCKHQLSWYDNIPIISYLVLKAKCRYCNKPISIQYPLVEAITGILFLIVFITTNNFQLSIFNFILIFRNWIFACILTIIFIYDLKYYLILDKITIPAMVVVLLLNYLLSNNFQFSIFIFLTNYLFSGLLAGGFFLIQFLLSRGRWIGGGDIRLGFLIGFMLGWPNILVALFLAYILGSVVGIGLIILKKKTMRSQVPFGTFLSFATLVALLFGDYISDWYLNSML